MRAGNLKKKKITFFGPMPGRKPRIEIASDFLKFSEAIEQQRIDYIQGSKLFTAIQFIPSKGCAVYPQTPEFCDPASRSQARDRDLDL